MLINNSRAAFVTAAPLRLVAHNYLPSRRPLTCLRRVSRTASTRAQLINEGSPFRPVWHSETFESDLCPSFDSSYDQESAAVTDGKDITPPSGGKGRDGDGDDGGGGGGGGGDDSDETPDSILKSFGKTRSDLPADIASLRGDALRSYLSATQGGLSAWLARIWPGWRQRVAADPDFAFKLLMEETVGLGLAASGMIAARGDKILSELDFAFCDIAVGATLNFILVYLLTPSFGVVPSGVAAHLPANLFAKGKFGIPSRIAGFLYKGVLFSICGFAGSVAGTTLSQGLLLVRKKVKASRGDMVEEEEERELPNILANSAAWAGFMFVSANPRYQAVSGMERILFGGAVPDSVAKICSAALRTGNNVLGGANWVMWAKAIGLQKSSE